MTNLDAALPGEMTQAIAEVQRFLARFGWYLLIGIPLIYFSYYKIRSEIYRRGAYDRDRVERLELQRREQRLAQQQKWASESAEAHAATREREREEERKARQRKFGEKKNYKSAADVPEADWLQQLGGGGGGGYRPDPPGTRNGFNPRRGGG